MCVKCSSNSRSRTPETKSCMYMYNELISLDLKVCEFYSTSKDPNLLSINSLLREWIKGLRDKCPDPFELQTLKEILNHEYSINS